MSLNQSKEFSLLQPPVEHPPAEPQPDVFVVVSSVLLWREPQPPTAHDLQLIFLVVSSQWLVATNLDTGAGLTRCLSGTVYRQIAPSGPLPAISERHSPMNLPTL